MKIQEDDHDDFERQDGPQTTSSKIKDLFEFEVNSQYDGGEADDPADGGDDFKKDTPQKAQTGADR